MERIRQVDLLLVVVLRAVRHLDDRFRFEQPGKNESIVGGVGSLNPPEDGERDVRGIRRRGRELDGGVLYRSVASGWNGWF